MYEVIEFWGYGDKAFGGQADDRSLCTDGEFRNRAIGGGFYGAIIQVFEHESDARAAADKATKRPNSLVSVSILPHVNRPITFADGRHGRMIAAMPIESTVTYRGTEYYAKRCGDQFLIEVDGVVMLADEPRKENGYWFTRR